MINISEEILLRILKEANATALAIYLYIKANVEKDNIEISLDSIVDNLNISKPSINTAVKKLKALGYIDYESKKASNANYKVNYYKILL